MSNAAAGINVLLTGAGAPGGPGIIQALLHDKSIRLTIADANPFASGRALHSDFITVPSSADPVFADSLLSICRERDIDVLLPLVTRELELLAGLKERFKAAGTTVVVSDHEVLQAANNKHLLMQGLRNAGMAVADFTLARTADELEAAALAMGYPSKPVVVKPSLSNGSRGMRILDTGRDRFREFFGSKPGQAVSTLEEVLTVLRGNSIPEMLVMEYLPGDEYTVDCLLEQGKPLIILPRKRIAMNNGISVAGIFENHQEIMDYTHRVFSLFPLHGPAGLQVRKGADGTMKILEINPRLQGGTTTAMGMGINLPLMAVHQAAGRSVEFPEPVWGLRFARIYTDLFFPVSSPEI